MTDKPKGTQEDGMLPDALVPHAKEWYHLCERRFAVEKITISGELAEAIVEAMGRRKGHSMSTETIEGIVSEMRELAETSDGACYGTIGTQCVRDWADRLEALEAGRRGRHPWMRFLEARADAIDWLHADGATDERIADIDMRMDPEQVALIRSRERTAAAQRQEQKDTP